MPERRSARYSHSLGLSRFRRQPVTLNSVRKARAKALLIELGTEFCAKFLPNLLKHSALHLVDFLIGQGPPVFSELSFRVPITKAERQTATPLGHGAAAKFGADLDRFTQGTPFVQDGLPHALRANLI
jgi:hypothetical protein